MYNICIQRFVFFVFVLQAVNSLDSEEDIFIVFLKVHLMVNWHLLYKKKIVVELKWFLLYTSSGASSSGVCALLEVTSIWGGGSDAGTGG